MCPLGYKLQVVGIPPNPRRTCKGKLVATPTRSTATYTRYSCPPGYTLRVVGIPPSPTRTCEKTDSISPVESRDTITSCPGGYALQVVGTSPNPTLICETTISHNPLASPEDPSTKYLCQPPSDVQPMALDRRAARTANSVPPDLPPNLPPHLIVSPSVPCDKPPKVTGLSISCRVESDEERPTIFVRWNLIPSDAVPVPNAIVYNLTWELGSYTLPPDASERLEYNYKITHPLKFIGERGKLYKINLFVVDAQSEDLMSAFVTATTACPSAAPQVACTHRVRRRNQGSYQINLTSSTPATPQLVDEVEGPFGELHRYDPTSDKWTSVNLRRSGTTSLVAAGNLDSVYLGRLRYSINNRLQQWSPFTLFVCPDHTSQYKIARDIGGIPIPGDGVAWNLDQFMTALSNRSDRPYLPWPTGNCNGVDLGGTLNSDGSITGYRFPDGFDANVHFRQACLRFKFNKQSIDRLSTALYPDWVLEQIRKRAISFGVKATEKLAIYFRGIPRYIGVGSLAVSYILDNLLAAFGLLQTDKRKAAAQFYSDLVTLCNQVFDGDPFPSSYGRICSQHAVDAHIVNL